MDMLARNVGMKKAIDNSTATDKAFFDPIKEKYIVIGLVGERWDKSTSDLNRIEF